MNFNNWEELGYDSKEDYQDAYDDYIVHKELEEKEKEDEREKRND